MTRLYVVKVLKGHIKFLAKLYHPAKCIDNEENMARKPTTSQECPLHLQRVRKSKDADQSSSHRLSAFCLRNKITIRLHGRNLWQAISMGSKRQKLNFCIQDGRCQPKYLLEIRHFRVEAIMDTTDINQLNNFIKAF